jgi:hypothetical protein
MYKLIHDGAIAGGQQLQPEKRGEGGSQRRGTINLLAGAEPLDGVFEEVILDR